MSANYRCRLCPGHAPELCPCPKTDGENRRNTYHSCALCKCFPCACSLPKPEPRFYVRHVLVVEERADGIGGKCDDAEKPWRAG